MNPIYSSLVYLMWFLATYYNIFLLLSLFVNRKSVFESKKKASQGSLVSILVPAFNEERSIADTIRSLKKLSHKKVEFIILNDGSKDNTSSIVKKNIDGDKRFIFIDNQKNKGKAACLNQGIESANGEFVACMDADSIIEENILEKVIPYFHEREVGAVTVSVEVKEPKSFLDKIISIEFNLGLSLFLKILSFFDCVFVTPGPFSIYRKSSLERIGGFDIDNITEDHEIAFRLHKSNFKIKNCIEAKVFTKLPDNFKGTYIQRRRWYSGALQTMVQHKDVLFKKNFGLFGFFVPFNVIIVAFGLLLFSSTTYLGISKFFKELSYYRYTNFNFFENFSFSYNILDYSMSNLFGMCMFMMVIGIMFLSLWVLRKKYKNNILGMLGFPFMFFLYQIFWGGAILSFIRGKKVRWR